MTTEVDKRLAQAIDAHQAHRFDHAKKIYQKLLKENPHHPDLHYLLGTLLCQQGYLAQSHQHLKRSLQNHPTPAIVYVALGHLEKKANKMKEAQDFYQKALEIDPTHANAFLSLGHLHRQQKQYDDALLYYQKATAQSPTWDEPLLHSAMIYQLKGQSTQAKEQLDILLNHHPKHPIALKYRGQQYLQAGDLETAIKWLLESISNYPTDAHAHHLLGTIYAQKKEADLAIEHFTTAITLQPDDGNSHHNLASLYYQKRDYDQARHHWLQQLEVEADAHTHYNIGQTYYHQGRHSQARDYFESTLLDQPEHDHALIALAAMAIKDEDYDRAIGYYQRILKYNPQHRQVQFALAALTGEATEEHEIAPSDYIEHLFDEYAPHFDRHLQEQLLYQAPNILRQCLEEHICFNTPKYIVDLGCGTGLCASFLKPWAKKLLGVDLSKQMLNIAKEKGLYHTLVKEDILTYLQQEKAHSIDLIVVADVLPYLGELHTFLSRAKAALNPQGHLIFTIETHPNKDAAYALGHHGRFRHNPSYVQQQLTKTGWQCICDESFTSRTQKGKGVISHVFLVQPKRFHQ